MTNSAQRAELVKIRPTKIPLFEIYGVCQGQGFPEKRDGMLKGLFRVAIKKLK